MEDTSQKKEENKDDKIEDKVEEMAEQAEAVDDAEDAEGMDEAAEEDAEEADGTENADGEGNIKKALFGKKKEKKDKKQELIDDLNDKLKRSMAEFDNFRKRTQKEKSQMYEIGAREVIDKILPVVDNFERGFAGVSEEAKEDPFVSGMDMVFKQLMTALEGMGVKPIEALGKEFDPNLHNAVMQVASEEYESGIVAQELQKGYMYKETVVRHSMVAVVE